MKNISLSPKLIDGFCLIARDLSIALTFMSGARPLAANATSGSGKLKASAKQRSQSATRVRVTHQAAIKRPKNPLFMRGVHRTSYA